MARGRARQIVFRIFYSTSFTIAFLLTISFACAGPIDALYQSYRRGRLIDMFIIAGVYVATGVISIFLYASRLYTNRSILKDIPKTYMPVDKYELPAKRVWRMIEDCKSRSAVIAYQARPRARRIENELPHARERINTLLRPGHSKEENIFEPQWGKISHPGWSSPAASETPNLAYATVVAELTDLIEARAVSLAPTRKRPHTPTTAGNSDSEPLVEPFIVAALRRPEELGMRQYIAQLIRLGVLDDNSLSVAFLTLYERARFAPEPISEDEFKALMRMFAEILRTMHTLDITRLDFPDEYDDLYDDDSEIGVTTQNMERQVMNHNDRNHSSSTISEAASQADSVRYRPSPLAKSKSDSNVPPPRISEDYPRSLSSSIDHEDLYTDANDNWASVTPRPPFFRQPTQSSRSTSSRKDTSRSRARNLTTRIADRSRSSRLSLARLRRQQSTGSFNEAASMRSVRSQGSVIRLVDSRESGREDRLFEFVTPGEEGTGFDIGPPRNDRS